MANRAGKRFKGWKRSDREAKRTEAEVRNELTLPERRSMQKPLRDTKQRHRNLQARLVIQAARRRDDISERWYPR